MDSNEKSRAEEQSVALNDAINVAEVDAGAGAIGEEALRLLESDYLTYRRRGAWFFAAAFVVGLALIAASVYMTSIQITKLEQSHIPDQMLIFLLVRGTFFGGLSIAFIFGLFTLGNAYVDQATRFRKRLYSAHMLNYAFDRFGGQIVERGNVTLPELVAMFGAWNENVDSAFSRVKFEKKGQNLTVGGKTLVAVEHPTDGRRQRESDRDVPTTNADGQ